MHGRTHNSGHQLLLHQGDSLNPSTHQFISLTFLRMPDTFTNAITISPKFYKIDIVIFSSILYKKEPEAQKEQFFQFYVII